MVCIPAGCPEVVQITLIFLKKHLSVGQQFPIVSTVLLIGHAEKIYPSLYTVLLLFHYAERKKKSLLVES